MKKKVYLDNNASTPLLPQVRDVIVQSLQDESANPSSVHALGQQARATLDSARNRISSLLKVKSHEIIFTSSATEGLNHLIKGIIQTGNSNNSHIITSNVEHAAVLGSVKQLENCGCDVSYIDVGLQGGVSVDAVRMALKPNTRLIVLMAVNNETGVKSDVKEIAALAYERKIFLIIDAVAQFGREPFPIYEGITAFCASGHKIHALKGIGFSYIRSGCKIQPLIHGGGQQFSRRGGTENLLGIISLAKAVACYYQDENEISLYVKSLRDEFERIILSALKRVYINGEGPRICNVSNLRFDGIDAESLLFFLDTQGIYASHGSACSSGAIEPSHVLLNMGLNKKEARSSLRFSFSRLNTLEEVLFATKIIIEAVKRMREKD